MPEGGYNPEFLRPEITKTSDIEGTFTRVTRLNGLPESIRRQYKEGMVLKEYSAEATTSTTGLGKSLFGDHADIALIEKARILRERQQAVMKFFADALPNLVVQSDFLIGQGPDRQPHIYELQENVPKGLDPFLQQNIIREFLESCLPDVRIRAIEEMRRFITRGRDLIDYQDDEVLSGKVIDLIGDHNVVLTKTGAIRLLDTNYLFSPTDHSLYKSYEVILNDLDAFLHSLEADSFAEKRRKTA